MKKNGNLVDCFFCGSKTYFPLHRLKTAKFCSKKCSDMSKIGIYKTNKGSFKAGQRAWNKGRKLPELSGEKSSRWKGGVIIVNGYRLIRLPQHPNQINGYFPEHRFIVEKIIGRYLLRTEAVHHINKIRTDNSPENLYLFSSGNLHSKHHGNQYLNKNPKLTSNLIYNKPNTLY
jgi:hypothetical protein